MIYVCLNTKGGVGKSITSVTLACILHEKGRKFEIIELDDNNKSLIFENSNFLNTKNTKSVKLDQQEEVISEILFKMMGDDSIDYILDAGGGNDTHGVLEIIKNLELPKKYLIPTLKIKKYLINAVDTYNRIGDPENTYFVLNQYSDMEKIENEFIYFFGSKKNGIKPVDQLCTTSNVLFLPFSNFFQISEDLGMTILDLASISKNLTQAEATKLFYQESKEDKAIFHQMMTKYWNSQKAVVVMEEIKQNFESLFE